MINILLPPLFIILQVGLEYYGFDKVAQQNTIFALLISIILILAGALVFLYKSNEKKSNEINSLQKQFGQTLSENEKVHSNKIDEIRKEIMIKEDSNNKDWRDSENKTLNVLNGVTKVLEMNNKDSENDNKIMISKLDQILDRLKDFK